MRNLAKKLRKDTLEQLKSLKPPDGEKELRRWAQQVLCLDAINPRVHASALDAFAKRDPIDFVFSDPLNHKMLHLVYHNVAALKSVNMYEKCLLTAYSDIEHNFKEWPTDLLQCMFDLGNRDAFGEAGDEIPADEPITVYRGVSGSRGRRRVRGLSWTRSLDVACWFACRPPRAFYGKLPHDPDVYKATVQPSEVYAIINGRDEAEVITRPQNPWRLKLSISELTAGQGRYTQAKNEKHEAILAKAREETRSEDN